MYKPLYILFFLLTISTKSSFAQNLVYNGDFEIYDTCPTNTSGPGNLQIEHCTGWTAPTKLGTSDYFNACNNLTPGPWKPAGVPTNGIGYQPAYNGNGYCGFYAWDVDFGFEYREYIQTRLTQPLIGGNKYQITFYVSNEGSAYSVEKIGALFSSSDFNANTFSPIVETPQVVNENGAISDSIGWTKIEGSFIAIGGEEYLTIGYFEDSLTLTDTLNPYTGFIAKTSYYFIDGVELIDLDAELIIPNIITPNGDRHNDQFLLNFPYEKVEIYNRWGNKVFESMKNDSYWDGRTTSGAKMSEGTYYYIIKTKTEKYKGFIQLLR